MRAAAAAVVVALALLVTGCGSGSRSDGTVHLVTEAAASSGSGSMTASGTRATPSHRQPATGVDAGCPRVAAAPAIPGGLPRLSLECLGGGPRVTLSGLRGTPTVINLWASWCAYCREEIPHLREFAERGRGRVAVLGVAYLDQPADAAASVRELKPGYPSVLDPSGRLLAGRAGLPVTLLVAGNGEIVRTVHGPLASSQQLADLVSRYLGVTL